MCVLVDWRRWWCYYFKKLLEQSGVPQTQYSFKSFFVVARRCFFHFKLNSVPSVFWCSMCIPNHLLHTVQKYLSTTPPNCLSNHRFATINISLSLSHSENTFWQYIASRITRHLADSQKMRFEIKNIQKMTSSNKYGIQKKDLWK